MGIQSQLIGQRESPAPKVIDIELLALDLAACTRCVGTLANIEAAIATVRHVLEGTTVQTQKIIIDSEDRARQYEFVTSPTIRINGRDIAIETLESKCDSCTDLCGCDEGTNCRVWRYQGKEYTEAPVGLVVEALLREIDGGDRAVSETLPYEGVPENLRRFFASTPAKRPAGTQSCCPPSDQATCCEPGDKGACCGASKPGTCGCR